MRGTSPQGNAGMLISVKYTASARVLGILAASCPMSRASRRQYGNMSNETRIPHTAGNKVTPQRAMLSSLVGPNLP